MQIVTIFNRIVIKIYLTRLFGKKSKLFQSDHRIKK